MLIYLKHFYRIACFAMSADFLAWSILPQPDNWFSFVFYLSLSIFFVFFLQWKSYKKKKVFGLIIHRTVRLLENPGKSHSCPFLFPLLYKRKKISLQKCPYIHPRFFFFPKHTWKRPFHPHICIYAHGPTVDGWLNKTEVFLQLRFYAIYISSHPFHLGEKTSFHL